MNGNKLIYRVLNVLPQCSFSTTTRIKHDLLACKNHFSSFLHFDSNTAAGNEFFLPYDYLQQQQHHISIHAHGSSCAQREKQWVKLLFIQSSVILSCIQFFMINVLLYILWSSINITLNGVSLRGKDCYDLSLSPNVCSVRSSWIKNETFMRTIIKWASFNEEKMLWLSEAKTS